MSSTMIDTHYVSPGPASTFPHGHSRISWGAIFAGTAVALSTSLLLWLVGLAIGASVLHANPNVTQGGEAAAAQGSAAWVVLSTLLSMALGGYVAGRLAGTYSHLDSELHGLTVWALTALLGAILLGSLVTAELSIVNRGIGTIAGEGMGAIAGATAPNGATASGVAAQGGLASQLEESLNTGGDPAHMTRAEIDDEIGLIVSHRLVNGSLAPAEQDRLVALIAQRDGLTADAARQRLARMEDAANGIETRARSLAANAEDVARIGARAVTASLLLGLAATLLGAWFGTRHIRRIVGDRAPVYGTVTETVVHSAPVVHTAPTAQPMAVVNFRGLSFPASKAELLRQARAGGNDASMVAALEAVTDRRYLSMEDLLAELHLAPV